MTYTTTTPSTDDTMESTETGLADLRAALADAPGFVAMVHWDEVYAAIHKIEQGALMTRRLLTQWETERQEEIKESRVHDDDRAHGDEAESRWDHANDANDLWRHENATAREDW